MTRVSLWFLGPLLSLLHSLKQSLSLCGSPQSSKHFKLQSKPPYVSASQSKMSNDLHSYPPPLHHLIHHHHHHKNHREAPESHESVTESDPVLVIDLEWLREGETGKLDEACKEWGIFRLVNHGIPLSLLEELEDLTRRLFSMSFESKQASCEDSPVTYFWGTPALTPSGTALPGGPDQKINLVEGFNVPLSQVSQFDPQLPLLQSFRVILAEYGKHLSRIAITLFEAMSNMLDLNIKKLKQQYVSEKTANIRLYRYPRSPNAHHIASWGMEPHTDSSVLSILNHHTQHSGLEVLKDHQWLSVRSIPNTLIINLGDMMQAMSDDRYKSALHRVRINERKERISVCYFVFPDDQFVIESSKYRPFTYTDFRAQVQQDIKTIGHKVGLSRFTQISHQC